MNIFEDLIEELKGENLLEETVIEVHRDKTSVVNRQTVQSSAMDFQSKNLAAGESFQPPVPLSLKTETDDLTTDFPADAEFFPAEALVLPLAPAMTENDTDFEESI